MFSSRSAIQSAVKMLTQIFYHEFAGDGTLQTSLAAGRVLAQGLDRHRQSLHKVQALSRSSSPNSRSGRQMGHPSPWQRVSCLLLVLLQALLTCWFHWTQLPAPPLLLEHSTCSVAENLWLDHEWSSWCKKSPTPSVHQRGSLHFPAW